MARHSSKCRILHMYVISLALHALEDGSVYIYSYSLTWHSIIVGDHDFVFSYQIVFLFIYLFTLCFCSVMMEQIYSRYLNYKFFQWFLMNNLQNGNLNLVICTNIWSLLIQHYFFSLTTIVLYIAWIWAHHFLLW